MKTLAELLAHALAMEIEAAERYEDLADQMVLCNNETVAELFRRMSELETLHVEKIRDRIGALELPEIAPWDYRWRDPEAPEISALDKIHYLMTPYQALAVALHNEQRALEYYSEITKQIHDDEILTLARELADEEREHVKLVEEWLAKYPEPSPDWNEDPDPPVAQD